MNDEDFTDEPHEDAWIRPLAMLPVEDVISAVNANATALEGARLIREPTDAERYRDQKTVMVCPTRSKIDFQVVDGWLNLAAPMNQLRTPPIFAPVENLSGKKCQTCHGPLLAKGYKVADAYNALVKEVLADPNLSRWTYLMTVEDDNVLQPDAHLRLLETMESGPWDAVSGLYYTKDDEDSLPMAYGDGELYRRTGELRFDVRADAEPDSGVLDVCGIPMGCALFRLSLFREIPPPWFVTVEDSGRRGMAATTQDIYFSNLCMRAGKHLAVDTRVLVGHKDGDTGKVYFGQPETRRKGRSK